MRLGNDDVLQTPLEFPRKQVLQKAASSVRSNGLLLIVSHGSVAPWQNKVPGRKLPTAEEGFAELEISESDWRTIFVGTADREGRRPEGQIATVTDTIIALERL